VRDILNPLEIRDTYRDSRILAEVQISGVLQEVVLGDPFPVRIMGAINLTANSFYSGSVRSSSPEVLETAVKMEAEGADIIDLGARSTAPYRRSEISVEKETALLSEAISLLAGKISIPLSVDTTRLQPAKEAFRLGVRILNDVYGLTQEDANDMAELVSAHRGSIILTAHERSPPSEITFPTERVLRSLRESLNFAVSHGIKRRKICLDPGIGFFSDPEISNIEWNSTVLAELKKLRTIDLPICVGLSRKKFLGQLVGDKPPEQRLAGSLSATAIAVYNGAHLIRTHDVRETAEAAKVARAIREKGLIPDRK
jgi:dihydropteroate synthase